MNFNEYQKETRRTATPMGKQGNKELLNYALGLSGESGEVADHVKKHVFQGHPLDIDHVAEELGDLLWYVARMADINGYDLSEVAQVNVNKLNKRFPNGFTTEDSIRRVDIRG